MGGHTFILTKISKHYLKSLVVGLETPAKTESGTPLFWRVQSLSIPLKAVPYQ